MNRCLAFALAISVVWALVGVACRPANTTQTANPASANSAASSTNRQTYEVKGVVKEVMPERKKAKIAHEEIPGYMEAMTMLLDVKDAAELKDLQDALIDKLAAERKDVHVMLVSLDLELDPDVEKVKKFVARKKIQAQVVILNERKSTDYIDKLEKNWSGALPATLVVNNKNGKRKFVERELHEGDLEKLITEVQ